MSHKCGKFESTHGQIRLNARGLSTGPFPGLLDNAYIFFNQIHYFMVRIIFFIFHNFMVKINTFFAEWWSGPTSSADRQGQNTVKE
jgi:hypothetical protein